MAVINLENFKNRIINKFTINGRPPIYDEYPEGMNSEINECLRTMGINRLYGHQTEMFRLANKGNNIIITTSTASGKTLSFLLPIINRILDNPSSRAIFIYPTKALASDQFRNFCPYIDFFGRHRFNAGIYDGDTPTGERSRIRKEANIILTNPEMLNFSFLPNHGNYGFYYIFKNLDFVVIDELHYYRGVFGSHLANIIRRLKRIAKYYNSNPQFFCSSATIANPVEHAVNICSAPFEIIDRDCSPNADKDVFFWVPPIIDRENNWRASVGNEATALITEMIDRDVRFIAFVGSRQLLEVILKESRERLFLIERHDAKLKNTSDLLSGYRGGYKTDERKATEYRMSKGLIRGVIATNALEMGIDIGQLDLVICAGFPKTKASFLQQIGRAGRREKESQAVLILDLSKTYDNYIAGDPEWVFTSDIENAVIDKNNLYIQLSHIRAASAEIPISLDDVLYFPDLGEILPVLIENGELKEMNSRYSWNGSDFPAGDYSLRTISNERFKVINKASNEMLTEMDLIAAFRETHTGAIYIHDGENYLVERMDYDNRVSEVKPVNYNYYTRAIETVEIKIINLVLSSRSLNIEKFFGDVIVSTSIHGFERFQFHNHLRLGIEKLNIPLNHSLETEALWVKVPNRVGDFFENHLKEYTIKYLIAISSAIMSAFMLKTMTTDNDIGNKIFFDTNVHANIAIYDKYHGGLGFAEKSYELIEDIIQESYEIVKHCKCRHGCPACVHENDIDKDLVLWCIKNFYENEKEPDNIDIPQTVQMGSLEQKPFNLCDIEKYWDQFKKLLCNDLPGASMAGYLKTIPRVIYNNNTVFLVPDKYIDESFLCSEDNIMMIKGHISRYFQSDIDYNIGIDNDEKKNNKNKIKRRYSDLKRGKIR